MDAPLSVKRFLEGLKARLEPAFASVVLVGEVSNARTSGRHWYFTLKEEGAALQCAVWASAQGRLKHQPKDGDRVVVKGSLNLYVPGGSLTFAVTHCERAGVGDLQQRLRELEAQLRAEGVFDRPKRELPAFPRRIGVVAALGGAALRDVLQVTARRAPGIDILIHPATAQGDRCVFENLMALQEISDPHWGCDVILLVRGGGSLEDLWGFNDPELVRAVAACPLPVVTGVGHEIDTTLVDLAADRRAATPSQAAELVTPDLGRLQAEVRRRKEALLRAADWRLRGLESQLFLLADGLGMRAVPERLARAQARLDTLGARLQGAHPRRRLALATQRFEALTHRLRRAADLLGEADRPRLVLAQRHLLPATEWAVRKRAHALDLLQERLKALDPKGPLARGFVLVRDAQGRPITTAGATHPGDRLRLQWLDGEREAEIRP
ncbi:MAG TPA: exodeoxyribonuclease VII large subunit [Holophagaceae bacterium]|nr:exodeoxyribonuclease VII large subunit [Holophagaceae bacterium]